LNEASSDADNNLSSSFESEKAVTAAWCPLNESECFLASEQSRIFISPLIPDAIIYLLFLVNYTAQTFTSPTFVIVY
jgi:hypothetical protein